MNFGTKVRTIVSIIAFVNQALVTIGEIDFGNELSNQIYKWISLIFLVGAMVTSHWYNNDFTPEACEGTGLTRLKKAQKKDDYIGEKFDDEVEDEQEDI